MKLTPGGQVLLQRVHGAEPERGRTECGRQSRDRVPRLKPLRPEFSEPRNIKN
jgi:hypothetical protein